MIDQPTIDRIMDAAQIYDVVSDFVTLRKRGELCRAVPLPRRQDALVLRLARQEPLQVLRLRQRRKSCTFHYAA